MSEQLLRRVVITGGTGFVGSALVADLRACGVTCVVPSRRMYNIPSPFRGDTPRVHRGQGEGAHRDEPTLPLSPSPAGREDVQLPTTPEHWRAMCDGADAVVNLAGESVAKLLWTRARKASLRASRIDFTQTLVAGVRLCAQPPRVLINASAVGFYGAHPADICTERTPAGDDFLATLARDWENAAYAARECGVRVACLRFGTILGPIRDGGMLKTLVPIFRYGLGGKIGHGAQHMSWIDRADVVHIIRTALTDERYVGPINAVAPESVTNAEFTRTLAKILHRPAICTVPAFALRMILREQADLFLADHNIHPEQLRAWNFPYRCTSLDMCLCAALCN